MKIYIRALKKWKNYQIRKHVQKSVLTQTRKVQLGKGAQLFFNKIQFQKLVKNENLKTLHRSLLFSTRKNIYRVFLALFLNVKKERTFSKYTKENRTLMHFENLELIQTSLYEKNNYKKTAEKMQKIIEKEEKNKTKNFSVHDDSDFNFCFNDILSDDFNKTFKSNLESKFDILNSNFSNSNSNLNTRLNYDFDFNKSIEGRSSVIKNNLNRYNHFNDTMHSNYSSIDKKNYKNSNSNNNYNNNNNNNNNNNRHNNNNKCNDDYDNNNNNSNNNYTNNSEHKKINNRQEYNSSKIDRNCIERAFNLRKSDNKYENKFSHKIPLFCVKPYFQIWYKNISAKLKNIRRLESHFSFLREK